MIFTLQISQVEFFWEFKVENEQRKTLFSVISCMSQSYEVWESAFSQKSYLETHIQSPYGEKPYAYEIRGSAFSQNSLLKRLVQIHGKEKKYASEENTCKRSDLLYYSPHWYPMFKCLD